MKKGISFVPNPNNVLVKITKASMDEFFYKRIIRDDGEEISLLKTVEEKEGYDQRFTQNVSVGHIVAVGKNVKGIVLNDIVILDYLASNDDGSLIGYIDGDRFISIPAKTTYHEKDARPDMNFRKAYVKGDFDELSKVLGVVRGKKIIAFRPYVVLNHESNIISIVLPNGRLAEKSEPIVKREVVAAGNEFKDGTQIYVKDEDLFERQIAHKTFSFAFETDVLCQYEKVK